MMPTLRDSQKVVPCVDEFPEKSSILYLMPDHAGFEVLHKLGSGSFSEVWAAKNVETEEEVALKVCGEDDGPYLRSEAHVLSLLNEDEQQGIQKKLFFNLKYCCLVTQRLGKTLGSYMYDNSQHGRGAPLQTTVLIAEQLIQRIEYVHSKGFLHRDLKPENMLWGLGDKAHHLHLIDFGLSKAYWKGSVFTGQHIPPKMYSRVAGTARYISINAHNGREQGRRDELETIGYLLLHMLKGALPWCQISDRAQVLTVKRHTSLKQLCTGAPENFGLYLTYCKSLKFAERPDYNLIYNFFHEYRNPMTKDHDLEWLQNDVSIDPGMLIPLEPREELRQPDDPLEIPELSTGSVEPKKRHSLLNFFKWTLKAPTGSKRLSFSKVAPIE